MSSFTERIRTAFSIRDAQSLKDAAILFGREQEEVMQRAELLAKFEEERGRERLFLQQIGTKSLLRQVSDEVFHQGRVNEGQHLVSITLESGRGIKTKDGERGCLEDRLYVNPLTITERGCSNPHVEIIVGNSVAFVPDNGQVVDGVNAGDVYLYHRNISFAASFDEIYEASEQLKESLLRICEARIFYGLLPHQIAQTLQTKGLVAFRH